MAGFKGMVAVPGLWSSFKFQRALKKNVRGQVRLVPIRSFQEAICSLMTEEGGFLSSDEVDLVV